MTEIYEQTVRAGSDTVWLHHLDFNKTSGEEATWELHKNAMCCFEQTLEAVQHKAVAIQPLTSYLTNHTRKTSQTYWAPLEEKDRNHKRRSSMDTWTH